MSKNLYEKLSDAQEELVDILRERMRDPKCPPQVYTALIKLLQQNNISAIINDDSDEFADLRDSIPDEYWEKLNG